MSPAAATPRIRLRTAFISDIHLGTKDCRAELLLEFLKSVQVQTLVLIGDVVDVLSLRRSLFWPQSHIDVVRSILGKARHGTRVVYVPGNHDDVFRELAGSVFGNLEIQREHIHATAAGQRLLVLHGDEFDGVVKCSPWLVRLGVRVYDVLLYLNRYMNAARRLLGLPYWSLASYVKRRVKKAVRYIDSFQEAAVHTARRRGVDGVVCGHVHRAALTEVDGLLYCNDGDWVETCSSLVEDLNGRLSLLYWMEERQRLPAHSRRVQAAADRAA